MIDRTANSFHFWANGDSVCLFSLLARLPCWAVHVDWRRLGETDIPVFISPTNRCVFPLPTVPLLDGRLPLEGYDHRREYSLASDFPSSTISPHQTPHGKSPCAAESTRLPLILPHFSGLFYHACPSCSLSDTLCHQVHHIVQTTRDVIAAYKEKSGGSMRPFMMTSVDVAPLKEALDAVRVLVDRPMRAEGTTHLCVTWQVRT